MFITSAALINDGKIISAIPEERISREKLSRKFPEKAINQILKENNLDINNIDIFSNSYNPANLMTKFNPIFSTSRRFRSDYLYSCLLYTSDAADDSLRVDLGGRRIIKKERVGTLIGSLLQRNTTCFFSSRRRHTRFMSVSWARRCV